MALIGVAGYAVAKGCAPDTADEEYVRQTTVGAFEQILRNVEGAATQPSEERDHLVSELQTGLELVRRLTAEDLRRPHLFVAKLGAQPAPDEQSPRRAISIQWLESGFTTTGLYIVDKSGQRYDFPQIFTWTAEEKRFYAPSAWRQTYVPVAENDESERSWAKERGNWKVLRIPYTALEGGKMGLISSDHKDLPAIPITTLSTAAGGATKEGS